MCDCLIPAAPHNNQEKDIIISDLVVIDLDQGAWEESRSSPDPVLTTNHTLIITLHSVLFAIMIVADRLPQPPDSRFQMPVCPSLP